MEKYDITSASKKVYFYKEYKHENLDGAVMYAEYEAKKVALKTAEVADL